MICLFIITVLLSTATVFAVGEGGWTATVTKKSGATIYNQQNIKSSVMGVAPYKTIMEVLYGFEDVPNWVEVEYKNKRGESVTGAVLSKDVLLTAPAKNENDNLLYWILGGVLVLGFIVKVLSATIGRGTQNSHSDGSSTRKTPEVPYFSAGILASKMSKAKSEAKRKEQENARVQQQILEELKKQNRKSGRP